MKFYVVWEGHQPGIYEDWESCKKQIHNFPRAKYKSFPSLNAAQLAYRTGATEYLKKKPNPALNLAALDENAPRPIVPSVSVDAACSGVPGIMEYRGVDTQTGMELFHVGPFPLATNNIGEFLAVVHALAMLKKQSSQLPIYSDSVTALSWVRRKKAGTKMEPSPQSAKVFELIARAERWLAQNTYKNKVLKWDTHIWGEIPADFGRK